MVVRSFACGAVLSLAALASWGTAVRGADVHIYNTIDVSNRTYNGNGNRIIAHNMGDGGQAENQKPIFKVTNGTVTNVRIGHPGCDGIHMYGNCTLSGVTWENVGEDAGTVKGSGTDNITGGAAYQATDKVFQLNAACTFTVSSFRADRFGTFIRQNGGTGFKCTINVRNSNISNGSYGIRTDSPTTVISHSGTTWTNVTTIVKKP